MSGDVISLSLIQKQKKRKVTSGLADPRDLQEARALWHDYATEEELDRLDALDEKPDFEWHGAKAKKGEIVVFPDSGCC